MDDQLRWGILGTGNIASQFAAGVSTSARGNLAAVASRGEDSAAAFSKKFSVPQVYARYAELIDDPGIDAVYVALPNSMHHEWTLRALRAGKHVLCEKPIAAKSSQAEEMFDVARQQGRVLMEAFMYRSHPMTHAVQAAVQSGEIGQLKLIRTSFCFLSRKIEGNIRFDPALAGGALMDVGCYCLSFSRLFAGEEPDRFQVAGTVHPTGVDDMTTGVMQFPSGVVAMFACGMQVQADNTAYLCGSEGYIEIPIPWKPPRENASFTIAHSTPPKMDGGPTTPPPRDTRYVSAPVDLYATEADDFAAAVLDGAPVRVTRADSMGNMILLDAMRKRLGLKS